MKLEYSHHKQKIIIGIILTMVLFLLVLFGSRHLQEYFQVSKGTMFFISRILIWCILLFTMVYAQKIEKQKLLIWDEQKYSWSYYPLSIIITLFIVLFFVIILGLIAIQIGGKQESDVMNKVMELFKHNYPLLLFTALTAGVTEELIFRGYLMPRLELLFKKPIYSIIISSLLFGLIHYGYGTVINVVGPIIIGIIFALHYYKFRNIKILIICHFLWDYIVILLKLNFQPSGH